MRLRTACVTVGVGLLTGAMAQPAEAIRALPSYSAVVLPSPEPEAGASFGERVEAVGDLNGDGVTDIAVASTNQRSGADPRVGRVWLFSGRTRELIRAIQNPDPQPGKGFGDSIVGIGDVSGDGVGDLVIGGAALDVYVGTNGGAANTAPCGAPEPNGCNEGQGRVYIFSGRTGSLIRRIESPAKEDNAFFGYEFALAMGDLNGDGFGDFAEVTFETVGLCDDDGAPGTPNAPCPFVGAAYTFSGKDGSLLRRFADPDPPEPYESFGSGSNPGDVTGDGVADLVLGAAFKAPSGRAFLFDGKTGQLVRRLPLPAGVGEGAGFGYGQGSGVLPGDVNGDGVRDLIVAAPGQNIGLVHNAGRMYLLSGKDGSLIRTLDDPDPRAGGSFGFFHASAGDLNDDGTPDVLGMRFIFPAHVYPPDPPPGAAAYVLDGRTGAALVTLPGMLQDGPGSSLTSPGDLNGDNYPDYVLGGRLIDLGAGPTSGGVIVELSQAPTAAVTPPAAPPPAAPPPAVTPPPPPPAAPIVRKRGRLSAAVTPSSDLRPAYVFRASGRLTLPAGVSKTAGCKGRISVQVKRGAVTISTRRASLTSNCTYSSRVSFANKRRFGTAAKLKFTVRFLGNARVSPAIAPARFARVRP